VAAVDSPSPRAALGAAALDPLLEPLEIRLHASIVRSERSAELLEHALGLPVHCTITFTDASMVAIDVNILSRLRPELPPSRRAVPVLRGSPTEESDRPTELARRR
jgi:hypothetical protein